MEELVIVGGGVAGLSCLNALADLGFKALLLEGSRVGAPKICGEFISSEVVKQLQEWGISPMKIRQVQFKTQEKDILIHFPAPAGAIARSKVEVLLMKRALEQGARVQENTPIMQIVPPTPEQDFYQLCLPNNEILQAKNIIVATGKFNQTPVTESKYIGIKFHMPYLATPATLIMHSLPGMYFGVVPISPELSNCAALIKTQGDSKAYLTKESILELIYSDPTLQKTFGHFELETIDWLQGPAPQFKQKAIPNWPRALWIGDALATLHPAIGAGFAHSVYTARLAAEFYLKQETLRYQETCKKLIKSRLFYGKLMHHALLNPRIANRLAPLAAQSWATNIVLKKIGYLA